MSIDYLYLSTCISMYIYIYMYIYLYIGAYIYVCIYMCVCARACVCIVYFTCVLFNSCLRSILIHGPCDWPSTAGKMSQPWTMNSLGLVGWSSQKRWRPLLWFKSPQFHQLTHFFGESKKAWKISPQFHLLWVNHWDLLIFPSFFWMFLLKSPPDTLISLISNYSLVIQRSYGKIHHF